MDPAASCQADPKTISQKRDSSVGPPLESKERAPHRLLAKHSAMAFANADLACRSSLSWPAIRFIAAQ